MVGAPFKSLPFFLGGSAEGLENRVPKHRLRELFQLFEKCVSRETRSNGPLRTHGSGFRPIKSLQPPKSAISKTEGQVRDGLSPESDEIGESARPGPESPVLDSGPWISLN